MVKKIKGILINVEKGSFEVLEIEDSLKEYYRILNCDCIEIPTRYIGLRKFKIVVDGNGFLKNNFIPSAVDIDLNINLVGNIFIVSNLVLEGDLTSLDEEDIEYLYDFIDTAYLKNDNREIKVLTGICG